MPHLYADKLINCYSYAGFFETLQNFFACDPTQIENFKHACNFGMSQLSPAERPWLENLLSPAPRNPVMPLLSHDAISTFLNSIGSMCDMFVDPDSKWNKLDWATQEIEWFMALLRMIYLLEEIVANSPFARGKALIHRVVPTQGVVAMPRRAGPGAGELLLRDDNIERFAILVADCRQGRIGPLTLLVYWYMLNRSSYPSGEGTYWDIIFSPEFDRAHELGKTLKLVCREHHLGNLLQMPTVIGSVVDSRPSSPTLNIGPGVHSRSPSPTLDIAHEFKKIAQEHNSHPKIELVLLEAAQHVSAPPPDINVTNRFIRLVDKGLQ